MSLNQVTGVRCFHRLRIEGRHHVCRHCGVLIEECPCVEWRQIKKGCPCCFGGGWVAVVTGHIVKFAEYLARVA